MKADLSHQKCVPCEGGDKPLTRKGFSVYLPQVSKWKVIKNKELTKEFEFKDFVTAIKFVDKIAKVAQAEGHHPDINIHDYKKVGITLSTHAIGGLSVNDFILATKIDNLIA